MARPPKLSDEQVRTELATLDGWELREGRLHKTFRFSDFIQAWGFMSRVALVAQAMDHHPDWSNVYSTVNADLSTHDVGGITKLDVALARAMNEHA